jgi:hypothetical protein
VKASGDSGTLERLGSSVLEWAMGGEKRDVEIGANVREQGELDWIGRTFSRRYMSPGISRSASPISFLFRRTTHTITSRSTRNRRQQKKNKEGKGRKRWRQLVERSLLSLSRLRVEEEWKRRETDRP